MKYRLLLWGIGKIYNQHLSVLKYFECLDQIEVVGIMANYNYKFNTLDGYNVYPAAELNNVQYDYIMIMSDRSYWNIFEDLLSKGLTKEKLLSYKVLEIPGLNFESYIQLKNSNISIISNNCWGGLAYNALGLEALSPFKNMFLLDEDYIKLLQNLKEYCSENVLPHTYGVDLHSKEKYPILKLKDIEFHCNHCDTYDEAIDNWERRVKKLNYDNLFVMMYTENKEIAHKFAKLSFGKKICFVF